MSDRANARRPSVRLLSIGRLAQLVLLLSVGVYLVWNDALWNWDRLFYDWQLRQWSHPVPDDIVIIGIDDASLHELGRWPWPRQQHAQLLDRLTQAQASAVFIDVVFAGPDQSDPAGDQQLAEAARRNGRVVLPVVVDQLQQGGQIIEVLPYPELAASVHLGHADIDLDRDGIVREVYLKAGLGEPIWPHVSVKLLTLLNDDFNAAHLPGKRNSELAGASPYHWVRDNKILIPFFGPPGHFKRYSYIDVLKDNFDLNLLRDKIVLIGLSTSTGMDDLPTPVSGESQTMPGVEIIANIVESLRQGISVEPWPLPWRLVSILVLAAVMLLLLTRFSPALALLLTLMMLVLISLTSLLALRFVYWWIPPTTAFLVTLATYIWWSWQRLESTVRFLNHELSRLGSESFVSTYTDVKAIEAEFTFLRTVLDLEGYRLFDNTGQTVLQWGKPLTHDALLRQSRLQDGQWLKQDDEYWCTARHYGQRWSLGLYWPAGRLNADGQQRLLDTLVRQTHSTTQTSRFSPLEIVQKRIEQVQAATDRLRSMRRFIQDSLAQMADGVIVTNNLGRVLLANPKAVAYLRFDAADELIDQPVHILLEHLDSHTPGGWPQLLRRVLVEREAVQLEANGGTALDLLVQIAPFSDQADIGDGLIVNFSDISALKASERRRLEMLNFMSHDLRSPIISIIAITQLADASPDGLLPPDGLENIRKSARKTLDLAEDFLQLARAESSEAYQPTEVDLIFVADTAIEQVMPQADNKETQIDTDYKIDEAWLLGDGALLERMLVNLLTNAIKYSPAGPTIEVGLDRHGEELCCWVQDNGSGIASEDIPKLFDRFQRLDRKEHRKERGAGLGLSFVKTVIDNHGGRVEVSSELHKGTRFSLYFPAHDLVNDEFDDDQSSNEPDALTAMR